MTTAHYVPRRPRLIEIVQACDAPRPTLLRMESDRLYPGHRYPLHGQPTIVPHQGVLRAMPGAMGVLLEPPLSRAIISCPLCDAWCIGVETWVFRKFILAGNPRNACATLKFPICEAWRDGVESLLSRAWTSAPYRSNTCTTRNFPYRAALCNGKMS